jgi:ABC-type polysaccharide/polyol phosphate transport system ATPase subunit
MKTTLLEVQDLDLVFPSVFFRSSSVRDVFVQALSSPWRFFEKRQTKHILKNLNFTISRGERLALVGVNGSGKTSLCRCLSGILAPSRGKVLLHGSLRAIIQTEAGFFPDLTGRENAHLLTHFLDSGLSPQERIDLAEEAIDFSELGSAADATMDTYSLGMKSRLSLSLTTARPQELLILDEVYNHSDEFFQHKMRGRIHKQIKDSGAVLMVSHYESDFMDLCTRGLVLQNGEIKYDGSVQLALKAYRFMNGVKHV